MIRRLQKGAILPFLLIISLLTACGFQLRGQINIASELAELSVSGGDRSFARDLKKSLAMTGIEITDDAPYRLIIVDLEQNVGQRSQTSASSYERLLTLTVTYQLETDDGLTLFNPITLSNERYVTQDQNQANAASNEERIIFNELRQDLMMSSVRRIAAISGESVRKEAGRARNIRKAEREALEAQE